MDTALSAFESAVAVFTATLDARVDALSALLSAVAVFPATEDALVPALSPLLSAIDAAEDARAASLRATLSGEPVSALLLASDAADDADDIPVADESPTDDARVEELSALLSDVDACNIALSALLSAVDAVDLAMLSGAPPSALLLARDAALDALEIPVADESPTLDARVDALSALLSAVDAEERAALSEPPESALLFAREAADDAVDIPVAADVDTDDARVDADSALLSANGVFAVVA